MKRPWPDDPLYRAILALLALDAVGGAILMLLAHFRVVDPALGEIGFGLGLLGGLLFLLLRRLAARRPAGDDPA